MGRIVVFVAALAAAVAGAAAVSPARGVTAPSVPRPLTTGFLDPTSFGGTQQRAAFANARRAGATLVRIQLPWAHVAPVGRTRPRGFNARNPGDRRYRWGALDRSVRGAVANGFAPLIYIETAPQWAQRGQRRRSNDGAARPSPAALADFATALARRYSGGYRGLPRVRYWQVWNEPNLSIQLVPQTQRGNAVSPELYRSMVNAAARAIHAVRRDNVVVAGALAPFGGNVNDTSGSVVERQERTRPLQFMRELLCMSNGARPRPSCNARTEFDVWTHHPYTYGAPTHEAFHADDVSLGDLGEMRALLDAAVRAGHVRSRHRVRFWVTEFSYDTRPPDPQGLRLELHARWVSEALYTMWRSGVSHVTWFLLRDQPFPRQMFQSGLYFRGRKGIASDRPKPALRAFRFPFVAFRDGNGRVFYWGRTPTSSRRTVVVEQQRGKTWRRVATRVADRYGIFQGRAVIGRNSGRVRARVGGPRETSLGFNLKVPRDFRFCPWGSFC